MEKQSELIQVKVTPVLERQLREKAEELNLHMSAYVRMVLTLNLKENERVTA